MPNTELQNDYYRLLLLHYDTFQGSKTGGKYSISNINVMAAGALYLTDDIQYHLDTDSLYIAPSGLIKATDLFLETSTAVIEEGGVIDLSETSNMQSGLGKTENVTQKFSQNLKFQ